MSKKAIVLIAMFFANTLLAHTLLAHNGTEAVAKGWTCIAMGQRNFGSPAGVVYENVMGRGPTENEAYSSAYQACFSRGLQLCNVVNCYNK